MENVKAGGEACCHPRVYAGRKKNMLFHNILMDSMDNIMLMLLFALFYETHHYIFSSTGKELVLLFTKCMNLFHNFGFACTDTKHEQLFYEPMERF